MRALVSAPQIEHYYYTLSKSNLLSPGLISRATIYRSLKIVAIRIHLICFSNAFSYFGLPVDCSEIIWIVSPIMVIHNHHHYYYSHLWQMVIHLIIWEWHSMRFFSRVENLPALLFSWLTHDQKTWRVVFVCACWFAL